MFSALLSQYVASLFSNGYSRLNENITTLNRETVELKIQITEIQSKLLTEERVKEIVITELLKQRIQCKITI